MRKMIIILGIYGVFVSGLVFAQNVDDFDAWMRTIDEKNQSVQRNIAAKNADAATADAKEIQETFKLVEGFWAKRGMRLRPSSSRRRQRSRQPRW